MQIVKISEFYVKLDLNILAVQKLPFLYFQRLSIFMGKIQPSENAKKNPQNLNLEL